ncbi:MAG: phosphatase domain-containing putative toxin [Planctomycetota bacterium]|jgi:protein tyrosine/serine phosphatase
MKRGGIAVAFVLYLVVSSQCAEPRLRPVDWGQAVLDAELKNFYKISDKVYRSEQPDKASFPVVERFGIKAVLNLREHHSDTDEAKGTGLTLYRYKLNAATVSEKQLLTALQFIKNSSGPILVHCWHGSDRTGVVVAGYRIVFQGWAKGKAIDEFKHGGYGYHKTLYPNLVKLLQGLDVAKARKQLGLPVPVAHVQD